MPESNNTNDPRVTVTVPAPSTGAEVAVTSEAGGNLKFDFDPAQATATHPRFSSEEPVAFTTFSIAFYFALR